MALSDLLPANEQTSLQSAASSQYNPLTQVTNAQGLVDTLANKYILKPASAKGLAGFVFDYEAETTITAQSEITDHYTEQNTYVNDQAAQKPQRIVLRGFVSELVNTPNSGVLGVLNTLQGTLTTLPALLGKYTPAITQKIASGVTSAQNTVNSINQTISRVQNVVGLIIGSAPGKTKQQKAYQMLDALRSNNTVFTLNTPFNYFPSVMIETLVFTSPEETSDMAELTVTVKEVRFAGTTVQGPGMSAQLAAQTQVGRSAQQSAAETNQGNTHGTPIPFNNLKSSYPPSGTGITY